jgi:phosphatidylinositol phospholipase C delta
LRAGADVKFYREQFHLSPDFEDRWLTVVYKIDGRYKTLHLVAATKDIFQMWDTNLRKLFQIRQELMNGLGNVEMREILWEKQYWNGEGTENGQKLDFGCAEKLCKRLSVGASQEELHRLFAVRPF